MEKHKIFTMTFSKIYSMYVAKVERKLQNKEDVDKIISWLTGYNDAEIKHLLDSNTDFETFFKEAPKLHPNRNLIEGVICGVRVEEIEDETMRLIRYLDKLIDELAKGKKLEKILR